jgi:hypothetical protein
MLNELGQKPQHRYLDLLQFSRSLVHIVAFAKTDLLPLAVVGLWWDAKHSSQMWDQGEAAEGEPNGRSINSNDAANSSLV